MYVIIYDTDKPRVISSLLPILSGFGGVDSRDLKNLNITLITINEVKINKKNSISLIFIFFFHLKFQVLSLVINLSKFEQFF